jgi:hypothetical protein
MTSVGGDLPLFHSMQEQSSEAPAPLTPKVGIDPATGAPVRNISGDGPLTIEEHLPKEKAPMILQDALAQMAERPLQERKVTQTNKPMSLTTVPPGEGLAPSPSPSPAHPPSPGPLASVLSPREGKGSDGNELNRRSGAGNFAETGKSQKVEIRIEQSDKIRSINHGGDVINWNEAQTKFFSYIKASLTIKDICNFMQEEMTHCQKKLPELFASDVTFVHDRRLLNLSLLILKEVSDLKGKLSDNEIRDCARHALENACINCGNILMNATDVVSLRLLGPQEKVQILKYLMHKAAYFSSRNEKMITNFLESQFDSLLCFDRKTRLSKVDEALKADSSTKFAPSALIDKLENIPFGHSSKKIVRRHDRCFVAVKFGGIRVPFYMSSGLTPKDGVAPGQWYPTFGIGRKAGWINKSPELSSYFHSPMLEKVARVLDEDFGDLREIPNIADTFALSQDTLDFLNIDMRETDLIVDDVGVPIVDGEGRYSLIDEDRLRNNISAVTALLNANTEDERAAAAHHLAELDFKLGKRCDTGADRESFIPERRAHYLTVGDPIVMSAERTPASSERKEPSAQKS